MITRYKYPHAADTGASYVFYAFYVWWVYFPQSGALAKGT
jgi:hypothetical protein